MQNENQSGDSESALKEELDELNKKITNATGLRERKKNLDENSPPPPPSAFSVAADLLGGVAAGGIIGYFLDKTLATLPLFFILCLLLGACGGFYNIIRQSSRANHLK